MKLFDLIEEVRLEVGNPNQEQRYLIHNEFSPDQWLGAGRIFLKGIDANSKIPSEVLVTLRGIQDYYYQHRHITHRQSLYIAHAIVDYWDEISIEVRSALVS
jgi:hypothetical protein